MSEEIDSSKSPQVDVYSPCSKAKMHVEPHKDKIELGQYILDLIHSDVPDSYILRCSWAKYYVTILDNYNKNSEVVLLSSKDGVLAAFDLFRKQNEHRDNRIRQLRTDGGGEYDSHAFEVYHDKHEIRWKATVPGNP